MSVPDFQSLMLPILHISSDGQEHTSTEASDLLARQFNLNEADLRELLPSGKQLYRHSQVASMNKRHAKG